MALVVLLRGVNVGGHKTFRPKALAEQLAHLGAVNIGAAGTFVFRGRVGRAKLAAEIAGRLPFEAEIVICQGREILDLVSRDPFSGQAGGPDLVHFVSVLAGAPKSEPELPLVFPARGPWLLRVLARHDRFVLGVYRRQMKAIGHLGALDRAYGVPVTTRNWNTIRTIAEVLEDAGG